MNDKLLERLDALAAKLGVAASKIWSIYVQQARVEAIKDTVVAVLSLCVAAAMAYLVWRLFKGTDINDDGPLVLGAVVLFCLALACAIGHASGAVVEFINPEYWALKQLMELAK